MKDQLIRYVDLLFAGAPEAIEIKQEILQNTLDRYDDLVSQGKSPQAAYSLSISGIGDVSELLQGAPRSEGDAVIHPQEQKSADRERKTKRAVAIGFYIISPIPLFLLSEFGLDTLGLCLTLLLVAAATALIIISSKDDPRNSQDEPAASQSQADPLRHKIRSTVRYIGLICFLVISFLTGAWLVTWLIFPLSHCISGLIIACLDLKEAL